MTSFLYPFRRPEEFYFIGICELFDTDVVQLQVMSGLQVQNQPGLNVGPPKPECSISPDVKEAFYHLHKLDKEFYDRALAFRAWRVAHSLSWRTALRAGRLQA